MKRQNIYKWEYKLTLFLWIKDPTAVESAFGWIYLSLAGGIKACQLFSKAVE